MYFTVARGVTIGTIEVLNSDIEFNTTQAGRGAGLGDIGLGSKTLFKLALTLLSRPQGTYTIVLAARLPIYNPNYAAVRGRGGWGRMARDTIMVPILTVY